MRLFASFLPVFVIAAATSAVAMPSFPTVDGVSIGMTAKLASMELRLAGLEPEDEAGTVWKSVSETVSLIYGVDGVETVTRDAAHEHEPVAAIRAACLKYEETVHQYGCNRTDASGEDAVAYDFVSFTDDGVWSTHEALHLQKGVLSVSHAAE